MGLGTHRSGPAHYQLTIIKRRAPGSNLSPSRFNRKELLISSENKDDARST